MDDTSLLPLLSAFVVSLTVGKIKFLIFPLPVCPAIVSVEIQTSKVIGPFRFEAVVVTTRS